MSSPKNLSKYFPFKTIREEQEKAINFAIDAYESGKRFVICEAGTGVGKSAIGLTIARYMTQDVPNSENYGHGAYFLTTQKLLQEQYIKDFGGENGRMKQIMSSSNYKCKTITNQTCAESLRQMKVENDPSSRLHRSCSFHCIYKQEKRNFISSQESITNFSYFLTETSYIGKLEPRQLLVIDEAHNVDTELSNFIQVTLSERFAKQLLKLQMPEIKTQNQALKWIKDEYAPKLFSKLKNYEIMISQFNLSEKIQQDFILIAKQYELLQNHSAKIQKFLELYDSENWIFTLVEGDASASRKLEFKPVDVSGYSEQMLFRSGQRILMMSATILNKQGFCKMLGINEEDCAFISIPSPFSSENHPIFAYPVAKMTASMIDNDLPKLVEAIQAILEQHPNEKGMIHAHNYKIAKYIKDNLKSKRIITHNSEDRVEKLKEHIKSKKPTVLLSPSMQEGVDLKDDLSRFQIICKIPYPYLGCKIVKKRMSRWSWWYSLQTAKTIVQSVGRSVRSESDHAVTYILDSDWEKFYNSNNDLFPEGFKLSLKKV